MRILGQVEGSVMWLLETDHSAVSHLRSAATRLGVDPERLVFAERTSLPDHLARLRAHCGRACKESREADGNKAKAG